jgi:quinol monooxygenase YgiN
MIIEQMSISATDVHGRQLVGALSSLVGPIQVQPGCVGCRLLQSCHEPNELVMEATWETVEDLTRHVRSDTYKRLLLLMELSPVAPVLKFYTVQEVRGLDLIQDARSA